MKVKCYTREFVFVLIRKVLQPAGEEAGKAEERGQAEEGELHRDFSRISAYGNLDRNGLWSLHLLN